MSVKFGSNVSFVVEVCITCGAVFAIPDVLQGKLKENGKIFYCPNGHTQMYGPGKIQQLEEKLKKEKADKEWWMKRSESNAQEAATVKRQLSATKGVLTRTKNRVAAGACPCCHRQFVNLQRHMVGQHPDYAKGEEENIENGGKDE